MDHMYDGGWKAKSRIPVLLAEQIIVRIHIWRDLVRFFPPMENGSWLEFHGPAAKGQDSMN